MTYIEAIREAGADPRQLETLFQAARQENRVEAFAADLETCYREDADNLLYAAWHYRLEAAAREEKASRSGINWRLALPVSIAAGLTLWLLSEPKLQIMFNHQILSLYLLPIGMLFALAFVALGSGRRDRRDVLLGIGVIAAGLYLPLIASAHDIVYQGHYADLAWVHLPILTWAAVGICALNFSASPQERFAFLLKSFEVFVTVIIFVGGGMIFVSVTYSLFSTLSIRIPDAVMRLLAGGVLGTISLLALANVYDPRLRPRAQDFKAGLARLIATLARLLLAPTLIVLAIYIFAILSNFEGPFKSRDMLGIYHAMLFAVLGLLLGATPLQESDLPQRFRFALRIGIIGVAGLAALVGLYALTAIIYRTMQDVLTMNRLALAGWDIVNVGIMATLIERQVKLGRRGQGWVEAIQSAFSLGALGYVVWAAFVIFVIPLVIR